MSLLSVWERAQSSIKDQLGPPAYEIWFSCVRAKEKNPETLVIETPDSNASIQKVTDHKNALIYHEHLFYWNEKALRMILKKLGFRILAIQHRSFDWKNAPIRASLARLGFFNKSFVNFGSQEGKTSEKIGPINNGKKLRNNPFRKLMRSMLAYLVHSLGRDDYIFVVAERT